MQSTLELLKQFSAEKITAATIVILLSIFIVRYVNNLLTKLFENGSKKYTNTVYGIIRVIACGLCASIFMLIMMNLFDISASGTIFLLVFLITSLVSIGNTMVGNISSGILVKFNALYKVGDYVQLDGYEGTVKSISYASTIIESPQGEIVNVPSSSIISGSVSVISPDDPYSVSFTVPVSSSFNPEDIINDLSAVIKADPCVMVDRGVYVGINDFTEDTTAVKYECGFSCRFDDRYDVAYSLKKALLCMLQEKKYTQVIKVKSSKF